MIAMKPLNYEITFEPDLKKFKFLGKERILLDIKKATNMLVLNSLELKIKNCYLKRRGKFLKPVVKVDNEKEEVVLKLREQISGIVELFIDFTGALNDKLVGFYRSKYHVNGKEKYLATTQFEAADARRAFPCLDHPRCKATFNVSMIIDKKLTAISNMPVIEEKRVSKNKKIVKFLQTPIMPTYLLYLGVGEFEFIEDKLGKRLIRVATTVGKRHQGKLALELGKKFLKSYEDYFQIKYPLPKLDLIALPDFASGAMENWGAITFRESALLYDPKSSSLATKQRIAEIISHEIAHQWFGNLVTMDWWNDLWLNESFATFMATKVVDKFYPKWELWDQFLNNSTEVALMLDSLESSHPIEAEVRQPSEISQIFDQISYEKGGSILRMLESFIGEEMFRRGLKLYLNTHKYGNAKTEDLWSALEKISGKPIKKMMNGWVRQTGYPLIEAEIKNSKLELSQRRFVFEKTKGRKELWFVPLSISVQGKDITYLLTGRKGSINIDGKYQWLKINNGQKGFYRVKYQKRVLDELKGLVKEKKLSNVDRWGIQTDLFSLVLAGEFSFNDYLNFLEASYDEEDYLTCIDIEESLYFMYLITSKEKFWGEIKEYNRKFLRKFFDRLGWEPKKNEKPGDTLLRTRTIFYLARMGDKEILSASKERFRKFLKKPESLNPDIRNVVYHAVAWSGDEKMHKMLVKLYRKAETQEEKRRFLDALGGFQDKKLLEKTLEFSLSSDVRNQDLIFPIIFTITNPYGIDIGWLWIKKNWGKIKNKVGKTKVLLSRLVSYMSMISDDKVGRDIRRYFEKNQTPGTEMAVAQTLERIRINAKLLGRIRKTGFEINNDQ